MLAPIINHLTNINWSERVRHHVTDPVLDAFGLPTQMDFMVQCLVDSIDFDKLDRELASVEQLERDIMACYH